jgi:hypothetical protein
VAFQEEEPTSDQEDMLRHTGEKIFHYQEDDVDEREIKKSYTMTANEI